MTGKLTVWVCSNCGNVYAVKPEKCVLAGKVVWPQNVESGCEKYPFKEKTFEGFVEADTSWDTYSGLLVVLVMPDEKEQYLAFTGDDAFSRQSAVHEMAKKLLI